MSPNTERNHFRYDILCVLTLVTRKLQVVCRRSRYRMTVLLSKMSIFCLSTRCEIRMARYASKHSLQSLSDKPFLLVHAVYLDTQLENFRPYVDVQHIERLLYYRRHSLCGLVALEIQLERYSPRHAPVVLWGSIVCVHCKPVYTLLFDTRLCLTTKLTYLMIAYYPPNNGFTASDASFYKN